VLGFRRKEIQLTHHGRHRAGRHRFQVADNLDTIARLELEHRLPAQILVARKPIVLPHQQLVELAAPRVIHRLHQDRTRQRVSLAFTTGVVVEVLDADALLSCPRL